jgi:hypothetical protein
MHTSDGSLTGSQITQDPSTWPNSDKIWTVCKAVANAEGYYRGAGTAPFDLNNPGDLSPGDEAGQQTCGNPQHHDGSAIVHFCTAEGGWRALYHKFENIVQGKSKVYPQTWTWQQVAQKFAGDSQNWLNNVTNYLGVSPSSTPAQYVNG